MRFSFLKLTSLCLSLIIAAGDLYAYTPADVVPSVKLPEAGKAFYQIPEELGMIEEFSPSHEQPASRPQLIYIQDAHDSFEAQMNIAKMIHYLVERYGVQTVFEEGHEGTMDTDRFFNFIHDSAVKEKVSRYLLDQLEIGGAEYAHINREASQKACRESAAVCDGDGDFHLAGADSLELHRQNIEWYRHVEKNRKETQADLDALSGQLEKLAAEKFDRGLRAWMKIKQKFDRGEAGLAVYLERTQQLFLQKTKFDDFQSRYPGIALLLAAHRNKTDSILAEKAKTLIDFKALFAEVEVFENDYAQISLEEKDDLQLFQYYKVVQLLRRLSEIRVSAEEYEASKKILKNTDTQHIAEFVARQTGKPLVLSKRWEANIQDAVHFYEAVHARDAFIEKAIRDTDFSKPVILVYGGFHRRAIKNILKRTGVSYQIMTPRMSAVSERHQELYKQRMLEGYADKNTPASSHAARASRAPNRITEALMSPSAAFDFQSELHVLAGIIQTLPEDASLADIRLAVKKPGGKRSASAALPRGELRRTTDDDVYELEMLKQDIKGNQKKIAVDLLLTVGLVALAVSGIVLHYPEQYYEQIISRADRLWNIFSGFTVFYALRIIWGNFSRTFIPADPDKDSQHLEKIRALIGNFSFRTVAAYTLFFAPFAEEIVMRGFLLPWIAAFGDSSIDVLQTEPLPLNLAVWGAIILSSLVFSTLHLRQNTHEWLSRWVFGSLLALIYVWTGDLIAVIVIHVLSNLIDVSAFYFKMIHPEDRYANRIHRLRVLKVLVKNARTRQRSEIRPLEALTWDDREEVEKYFKALTVLFEFTPKDRVKSGREWQRLEHPEINVDVLRYFARGKTPAEYYNELKTAFETFRTGAGNRAAVFNFIERYPVWARAAAWFRSNDQLDEIVEHVRNIPEDRIPRILVHGAWNGEDAYAIALMLRSVFPEREFYVEARDIVRPDPQKLLWIVKDKIHPVIAGDPVSKLGLTTFFEKQTDEVVSLRQEYLGLVHVAQEDMTEGIQSDEPFDVIVTNRMFYWQGTVQREENVRTAAENIYGAMRPGGLWLVDNFVGDNDETEQSFLQTMTAFNQAGFNLLKQGVYEKPKPELRTAVETDALDEVLIRENESVGSLWFDWPLWGDAEERIQEYVLTYALGEYPGDVRDLLLYLASDEDIDMNDWTPGKRIEFDYEGEHIRRHVKLLVTDDMYNLFLPAISAVVHGQLDLNTLTQVLFHYVMQLRDGLQRPGITVPEWFTDGFSEEMISRISSYRVRSALNIPPVASELRTDGVRSFQYREFDPAKRNQANIVFHTDPKRLPIVTEMRRVMIAYGYQDERVQIVLNEGNESVVPNAPIDEIHLIVSHDNLEEHWPSSFNALLEKYKTPGLSLDEDLVTDRVGYEVTAKVVGSGETFSFNAGGIDTTIQTIESMLGIFHGTKFAKSELRSTANPEVDEFFKDLQQMEGVIYYPFALTDLFPVLDLASRAPHAKFVLSDAFVQGGADWVKKMPDPENNTEVRDFLMNLFLQEYTNYQFEIEITDELQHIFHVKAKLPPEKQALYNINQIEFEYRSGSFEELAVEADVMIVRGAGFGGIVADTTGFWYLLRERLKNKGYVLFDMAEAMRNEVIPDGRNATQPLFRKIANAHRFGATQFSIFQRDDEGFRRQLLEKVSADESSDGRPEERKSELRRAPAISDEIRMPVRQRAVMESADVSVILQFPHEVVYALDLQKLNAMDEEAWLELLGLKAVNEEKLHLLVTGRGTSTRLEQLKTYRRVYEDEQIDRLFKEIPEGTSVYYFSSFDDGLESLAPQLAARIKSHQYFGIYPGAFGTALLDELKEGRLPGLESMNGYRYDPHGIYTADVLSELYEHYAVVAASA